MVTGTVRMPTIKSLIAKEMINVLETVLTRGYLVIGMDKLIKTLH